MIQATVCVDAHGVRRETELDRLLYGTILLISYAPAIVNVWSSGFVSLFVKVSLRPHEAPRGPRRRQVGPAGFPLARIDGDRSQSQQEAARDAFREGRHRVRIATDVATRGLDVLGITH